MTEEEISILIENCANRVHKDMGPGLPASVYEECLVIELNKQGLMVNRQKEFPVKYGELTFDCGFRVDLLVENKVMIKVRAGEPITDLSLAQMHTWLKHSNCKLGFLLNFNKNLVGKAVKRVPGKM
ncbi:MAG: GxxExxY protein [Bacteroidetes bacterium]|nr:GxxExxY protein [Bacteroidota bacterium]